MFSLFAVLACVGGAHAGEREERRIRAGLDLFPSFVAADLDLEEKRDAEGRLFLIVHYVDSWDRAEEMVEKLVGMKQIRGIALRVQAVRDSELTEWSSEPPMAIFFADGLPRDTRELTKFSLEHGVMLFSPFPDDLQRGAHGGIWISDRILPQVDLEALEESKIRLKSFFLKVAKHDE